MLVASGALGALYRAGLEAQGVVVRDCDAGEAVRRGLWSAAHSILGGVKDKAMDN